MQCFWIYSFFTSTDLKCYPTEVLLLSLMNRHELFRTHLHSDIQFIYDVHVKRQVEDITIVLISNRGISEG